MKMITKATLFQWTNVIVLAVAVAIGGCSTMSVSEMEKINEADAPSDQVELTKEIQKMLKSKGFYAGPIDGIGGPGTLSALTAYQNKNGLPSTNGINAKAYGQLSIWDSTRELNSMKSEQENKQARQDAAKNSVRFISPEQAKTCEYVTQIFTTAPLSHFGGIEKTEEWAREELKAKAADNGANGLRVADRIFDKGRGGYDQTRLTLYGDIYKCPQKAP
jgi:peptidoglycan hydrolase-like protein with peptidoglycan-binding domain